MFTDDFYTEWLIRSINTFPIQRVLIRKPLKGTSRIFDGFKKGCTLLMKLGGQIERLDKTTNFKFVPAGWQWLIKTRPFDILINNRC